MNYLIQSKTKNESDYIPEEFKKEIELHICKNILCDRNTEFKAPLILAISGPIGMGKSYQTIKVLESMNISINRINASEFEDASAGIPIKNFLNVYISASEDIMYHKVKTSAILIDDADAALGTWGGMVQYTMNRQHLIKTLIDLADNPKNVTRKDDDNIREIIPTHRIPIILTLNDETKMYPPLMRPGRTRPFKWTVGQDDLVKIIMKMFSRLSEKDAKELFEEMLRHAQMMKNDSYDHGLPVSLFTDIQSNLLDRSITKLINDHGVTYTMEKIHLSIKEKYENYHLSDLKEIGKSIITKVQNYLKGV